MAVGRGVVNGMEGNNVLFLRPSSCLGNLAARYVVFNAKGSLGKGNIPVVVGKIPTPVRITIREKCRVPPGPTTYRGFTT